MATKKQIPSTHVDLLERPIVGVLATTLPDDTPQATPVWFNYENGAVYFNSAAGRLKDKAIRKTPYVAVTVIDPEDPYRYIQVRGPVVEMDEATGREHINYLSKRYTGNEVYPGPPTEQRIRYKMEPEHVSTMG